MLSSRASARAYICIIIGYKTGGCILHNVMSIKKRTTTAGNRMLNIVRRSGMYINFDGIIKILDGLFFVIQRLLT